MKQYTRDLIEERFRDNITTNNGQYAIALAHLEIAEAISNLVNTLQGEIKKADDEKAAKYANDKAEIEKRSK